MKKMLLTVFAAGLTAVFAAGCVHFEYDGESAPASDAPVKIVRKCPGMDKCGAKRLGKAVAWGNYQDVSRDRLEEYLKKEAAERGANVVLVTEINHKESGTVRSDQVKNLAAPTWTPVDDSGSNVTSQRNMDLYMTGNDQDLPVYEITVKARFYRIPKDLLVKDPVLLRGNPKPGRRTAPKKDDTTIRIR